MGAKLSDRRPTDDRETGAAARRQLAAARVLVVGAGGLGTPAAAHLAAAGVGTIGLVDFDVVDPSNLHRQVLYTAADHGRAKVEALGARLVALHPQGTVETVPARLGPDNAPGLLARFDFVIDGTDALATKFLVNDAAVATGTPYSHAGVLGFLGQTMTVLPRRSTCYRCLFGAPPPAGEVPSCQEAGILGPVAGVIGTIQAAEAIRYLLGADVLLADRLLTYDALRSRWRTVQLRPNPRCAACAAPGRFPAPPADTAARPEAH
jgi:molybdopterin/thiamine biosynthesis adenylyltransferase